jgi:hypothetical protein
LRVLEQEHHQEGHDGSSSGRALPDGTVEVQLESCAYCWLRVRVVQVSVLA